MPICFRDLWSFMRNGSVRYRESTAHTLFYNKHGTQSAVQNITKNIIYFKTLI